MGKFIPHPYQRECINAVIERPGVALWLEMGLGKTVVTLTAIGTLIQLGEVDKVLIIAPKRSPRQRGRTRRKSGNTCKTYARAPCWAPQSSESVPFVKRPTST